MEYDGHIKEEEISFKYTMTVYPDNVGETEGKVKAVEAAFIVFLVGKLDCNTVRNKPSSSKDSKSRRRHLGRRRKLEVIGLNPSPADNVVGKCSNLLLIISQRIDCVTHFPSYSTDDQCGTECFNIGASMTALTNGDDHSLCALMEALAAFAEEYESGTIDGVTSLGIDESSISVDGAKCNADPIIPSSFTTVLKDNDDNSLLSAILFPALLLAFIMFAVLLFVRKRRRRLEDKEEEQCRLRSLREAVVEDDDMYAFGAGYRKYALNAVNVHKCHSAQCSSCNDSSKETEFLPLENVSKWVEHRNGQEEEYIVPANESNEINTEEQKMAVRSRIIEDAKRVLRGDQKDEVEADRLDDQLRGLPTVIETSDGEDTGNDLRRKMLRADNDTGSI